MKVHLNSILSQLFEHELTIYGPKREDYSQKIASVDGQRLMGMLGRLLSQYLTMVLYYGPKREGYYKNQKSPLKYNPKCAGHCRHC